MAALARLFGGGRGTKLSTSAGQVELTAGEERAYGSLFTAVDNDGDGKVAGAEGALFLRRSRLPDDVLREVWRWACGGTSKAALERADWLLACCLVACAQAGFVCSPESLVQHKAELSLAEFYCANTAIVGSLVLASDAAACNIGVQVGSPTAVRSGLSGHIVYEVVTTTGLQHFPQSMMTVQRRFSDFEWLHGRLCTQFPDIMLPLFPSKRVFGNQDDAFLKQRMAALHQYINAACNHARVATQSFDLVVFLGASKAGFAALKTYIESCTTASEEGDTMLDTIANATSGGDVAHIGHDEQYLELQGHHARSLARLTEAAAVGETLHQRMTGISEQFSAMASCLQSLGELETQGASAGSGVALAAQAERRRKAALASALEGDSGEATARFSAAGGDLEAAKAFQEHQGKASSSMSQDQFASMFEGDLVEHAASTSTAAAVARKSEESRSRAERTPSKAEPADPQVHLSASSRGEMLTTLAGEVQRQGHRLHDQQGELDATLYAMMRAEQVKEAELAAATQRRQLVLDAAKRSAALLARRRKESTTANASGSAAARLQAAARLARAERKDGTRQQAVQDVTDGIKAEMLRVMAERRALTARRLHKFTSLQAAHATARAQAWVGMANLLATCSGGRVSLPEAVAAVHADEAEGPVADLFTKFGQELPFAAEGALPGAAGAEHGVKADQGTVPAHPPAQPVFQPVVAPPPEPAESAAHSEPVATPIDMPPFSAASPTPDQAPAQGQGPVSSEDEGAAGHAAAFGGTEDI